VHFIGRLSPAIGDDSDPNADDGAALDPSSMN